MSPLTTCPLEEEMISRVFQLMLASPKNLEKKIIVD